MSHRDFRCFVLTCLASALAVGCGRASARASSDDMDGLWGGNLTLVNSHWRDVARRQDQLRTGDALYLQTLNPALVTPGARYQLRVENLRLGRTIAEQKPRADAQGVFEMATVLNEVGMGDGTEEGDELRLTLTAESGIDRTEHRISLRVGSRLLSGELGSPIAFDPWVQASDAAGTPANAFVIESDRLPTEHSGPVHVVASGFPRSLQEVDVYVVQDRDRWAGKNIPRSRVDGWVAGPIKATVVDGKLGPVSTGVVPREVGIFDILIDVDRDGVFDYGELEKDGADGEAKVGFTVQHSAKWLAALRDRHLLVNLAYDGSSRNNGTWRNLFHRGEKVFVYVNPPVNKAHHGTVTKWVVHHRDFKTYWDVPDAEGRVDFQKMVVLREEGEPQEGCTNTPPTYVGEPDPVPSADNRYDVVLDYNGDGKYEVGTDILDCTGIDNGADMIDPNRVRALAEGSSGGFQVID